MNPARPYVQRPPDHALVVRISPFLRQCRLYFGNRIDAVVRGVPARRRPGTQEPGQLTEIPPLLEPERRRADFSEWEVNRSVPLEQELSLRVPPWLEQTAIELMNDRVESWIVENGVAVAPDGDRAAGSKHSPRFSEKRADVEPVQRLCGGDEIYGLVREPARFRSRAPVFDVRRGYCVLELCFTRVSCDYTLEVSRQPEGRLTVSGARVQSETPPRWKSRERVEERRGIRRPILRVKLGALGEVVFFDQAGRPRGGRRAPIPDSESC